MQKIGVREKLKDGDGTYISIHALPCNGKADTLCGINAYDGYAGHYGVVHAKGPINCPKCKLIWTIARQYKKSDFAKDGDLL